MISDKITSPIDSLPSIPNIRNSSHRLKKITAVCNICHQSLNISIDTEFIQQMESYPFSHLILHSHPSHSMHGLIVYIDAQGHIRGTECVESIQFSLKTEMS